MRLDDSNFFSDEAREQVQQSQQRVFLFWTTGTNSEAKFLIPGFKGQQKITFFIKNAGVETYNFILPQ